MDEVHVVGPCFCKMLVPGHVVGALIGRQGSMIAYIELLTRCQMQISTGNSFFPGTNDRIVILGGTMQGLEDCLVLILQKLREFSGCTDRHVTLRLVAPNSAVSALIGRGGHVARSLSNGAGCRINVSPRVGSMQERLVMLSGEYNGVARAALVVLRSLQADPHLSEHLCLRYNVDIPLGAWAGAKAAPADPDVPLVSPARARGMTKREIVEYLRKVAPREILMRHSLMGSVNNTVKCKSAKDLEIAVVETWHARGGERREEAWEEAEEEGEEAQEPAPQAEDEVSLDSLSFAEHSSTDSQRTALQLPIYDVDLEAAKLQLGDTHLSFQVAMLTRGVKSASLLKEDSESMKMYVSPSNTGLNSTVASLSEETETSFFSEATQGSSDKACAKDPIDDFSLEAEVRTIVEELLELPEALLSEAASQVHSAAHVLQQAVSSLPVNAGRWRKVVTYGLQVCTHACWL